MDIVVPVDLPDVEKAEIIARAAHTRQKRRNSGKPYITHPAAIAEKFPSHRKLQAVSWLHDVIEDTPLTAAWLLEQGLAKDIVEAVVAMTRVQGENYLVYLKRVSQNWMAIQVKMEDIKHNLSDLPNGTLYDKYLLALEFLEREWHEWTW